VANPEHLEILKKGVKVWNEWRIENPDIFKVAQESARWTLRTAGPRKADLSGAHLNGANLGLANLMWADLSGAHLMSANLRDADFQSANLSGADLSGADLVSANLQNANLIGADLSRADLMIAKLIGADLSGARLPGANLLSADLGSTHLSGADLSGANLCGAKLGGADLRGANLVRADMRHVQLYEADLCGATLSGCWIHGISTWDLKTDDETKQDSLIITPRQSDQEITVDSLEIAQFLYLVLNNEKLGHFIRVMRTTAVLILGSFGKASKDFLEALRAGLRAKGFVPVIFDFDTTKSSYRIETVHTLAILSNFVVVDLSEPAAEYFELGSLVPNTFVPFITIARRDTPETKMLVTAYHWFANEYIPYPRALEEAKKNIPNLIENQIMPIAEEINRRLRQENNM
jgi:uncharacterized protein YjbI with pentapeptide repeats